MGSSPSPAPATPTQVMMELAAIAYAPNVATYLDQQQYLTLGWELAWSPAPTHDDANFVYIAKNAAANAYALAIRGTYPEFNLGLLIQLYEDLAVETMVPWDAPPTAGARIAAGTDRALRDVTAVTSAGLTLQAYLAQAAVPANADIYVTGHSLGGCVATVLAPWLHYQLRQTGYTGQIRPYTYAAPTAGNAEFAQFFDSTFADGRASLATRVYNKLDLVPLAWDDLRAITALYPPPGPPCPALLALLVDRLAERVAPLDYGQPTGNPMALGGTAVAGDTFWAEAAAQHGHNAYLALLDAPSLPFLVETTRVTWHRDEATGRCSPVAEVRH